MGNTLQPILETIERLSQQIWAYDGDIERLSQEAYLETQPFLAGSGVGALTALTFVLTLEDPRRLAKSRQVGPALGLVPMRDQSGDHKPLLRITKSGKAYLRQLLVNWAHYILGALWAGLRLAALGGFSWPNEAARTPRNTP